MKLKFVLHSLLLVGFWLGQDAYAQSSIPAMIEQIDKQRLPHGGFEAEIVITPRINGVEQEPGRYSVKTNGTGQVLVEAKNPDQRGQKFLTTDSGVFFFAPRTKRAIRITPLQSLRGQASIGDISRLRFAADYQAEKSSTTVESCKECVVFELVSKNEAATYAKIQLAARQVAKLYEPVMAKLFLASGKLTKTVEFGTPEKGLPASTRYIDAINTKLETKVAYLSIKQASFPTSMFNPRSLEQ